MFKSHRKRFYVAAAGNNQNETQNNWIIHTYFLFYNFKQRTNRPRHSSPCRRQGTRGFFGAEFRQQPAWIAEEKGIFRKYDIESELIVVGGGATRAVSAVMAGDLQFGTTGGGAAISAALGGADVVMVAAGNNKGVQRLIVKPEIKTPEALKGKRIGVTALGSSGHCC
jgi:NMT1/THI5 like